MTSRRPHRHHTVPPLTLTLIDPTVDVVFKYIFGEPGASEDILMNLLNDLL
jgi:hypothetical protein